MEKNGTTQNHNDTPKKSSFRRYIIPAVLVPFLIIAALVFSFLTWEPKPDPASEKIIRKLAAEQLNKDPNDLTDEDFMGIINFTIGIGQRSIMTQKVVTELSDIKLLEKFTNLQTLQLFNIKFPENAKPKWIKILRKLGFIDLETRYTLDLSPLEKLSYLQKLELDETPVDNFKPISGLTNLEKLINYDKRVADLKPIKSLTNLQVLFVSQVSNLEPLKGLSKLQELRFGGNKVSDLTPLKG